MRTTTTHDRLLRVFSFASRVEEHNSRSTCTSSPEWLHARLIHLKTSASNWKTNVVVVGIEFNCIRWSVDWSVTIPQNPADGQSINKYKDDVAVSGVIPRNSIPLSLSLSLLKKEEIPHVTWLGSWRSIASILICPFPHTMSNQPFLLLSHSVSAIYWSWQALWVETTAGRQHTHTHTPGWMDGWSCAIKGRRCECRDGRVGPPSHTHTNI